MNYSGSVLEAEFSEERLNRFLHLERGMLRRPEIVFWAAPSPARLTGSSFLGAF